VPAVVSNSLRGFVSSGGYDDGLFLAEEGREHSQTSLRSGLLVAIAGDDRTALTVRTGTIRL